MERYSSRITEQKKELEKAVSRLMARHREEDAEGAANPQLVEDSAA